MTRSSASIVSLTKTHLSEALHPLHTIWVKASAGSGKTKLLIDRLLRLLLEDVNSQRILCLTFSKAATYEIEQRLLTRAQTWAALDKAILQTELTDLLSRTPGEDDIRKARCLYATLLDATQPIVITTIHAFAQKLLQQFAMEADIDPYFQVIDETDQIILWSQACDHVLEAAHNQKLPQPIIDALHWLSHFIGENQFHHLTQQLRLQKNKLQATWSKIPDLETYRTQLIKALDADLSLDPEKVIKKACSISSVIEQKLQKTTSILATGSKTDQDRAHVISTWLGFSFEQRCQGWDTYCRAFLVDKGEGHGWQPRHRLATKALIEQHSDLLGILLDEAERLLQVKGCFSATLVAKASYAIACYGITLINVYESLLEQKQAIDFNGLIKKTVDLLTQKAITPWVLYKLDGGLDHILVDEAQDTNPEQWQILVALLEHFYSNGPDPDHPRSVFVVGDAKQSIYGFQGADPTHYLTFRDWLEERAQFYQFKFVDLSLNYSFRSTSDVLQAVDQVFNHHNLTSFLLHEGPLHHLCWRDKHPGQVILWPLVRGEGDIPPPWALPTRRWLSHSAARVLAEQIADEIQTILEDPIELPSTGQPARPQDIMILIRHRSEFDIAMIRALKTRGIPVQSQNRSRLLDHLVIQDLIALAEWSLLPTDDFSLAVLLKAPFCDHDEQDLFDLAYDRGEISLWDRLAVVAQENPEKWAVTFYFLEQVIAWSCSNPYHFFQQVLHHSFTDGSTSLKLIEDYFGSEGTATIEKLLDIAQLYDSRHGQGLQSFCQWLRQTNPVYHFVHLQTNSVRLQTIHSAKGLQAPIVFLPDTTHTPVNRKNFLWGKDYVLWAPQKKFWSAHCYDLEEDQHHGDLGDYYRLLYVAMTRAQDRLYIAGWSNSKTPHPQSWYVLLQQVLGREQITEDRIVV